MSYKLFLDDIRQPQVCLHYMKDPLTYLYGSNDWVIVKNYAEFIEIFHKLGMPNLISFDHDLAKIHYEKSSAQESFKYWPETGYDCVKWLVEYHQLNPEKVFPKCMYHTMNPSGEKNMRSYINNYLKTL